MPRMMLVVCCFGLACTATPPAPRTVAGRQAPAPKPTSGPAAERLTKPTELTTASGGHFTAPGGWLVRRVAAGFLLQGPDRELTLGVLENRAADAVKAINAGWRVLRPGVCPTPSCDTAPVRQRIDLPPRDGWEAVTQLVYESTARNQHTMVAVALKKSGVWYLALIAGTKAAVDRRSGALNVAIGSLKAPGIEEESFAGKQARTLDAGRIATLDTFTEQARRSLHLPGVALALIQGGKVIHARGFGVRQAGQTAPITPDSLFLIGSITKSMTTLMMGVLVDRGLLGWDTRVTKLMPSFALGDAEATSRLTLQHTVCACTGLPRQDLEFLFEYRGITPEQRMAEMRSMKPTTRFGEAFQYSNPMVSAGGFIAAHTLHPKQPLGRAYDDAMQALVFEPLGMKGSTFDFKVARRRDHAMPHGHDFQLSYVPLPLDVELWLPSVRPAGGAWSSARDMARYVLAHLLKGQTPEGRRVISEANLAHRYQPQVKISDKMSYGLGLITEDRNGIPCVSHTGGTAGFATEIFFFPSVGVGAVVLTNGGGNFLSGLVKRRLLELLFDGKPQARENLTTRLKILEQATARARAKIDFAPERTWLSRFTGGYASPGLGRITISLTKQGAILDAGEWTNRLGRMREVDGTQKLVLLDPPWIGIELVPEMQQGKMTLVLNMPQQTYRFVRGAGEPR